MNIRRQRTAHASRTSLTPVAAMAVFPVVTALAAPLARKRAKAATRAADGCTIEVPTAPDAGATFTSDDA